MRSKREGSNVPGSDDNIMLINKYIQVKPYLFEDDSNTDFIMEFANAKPGFTKLRLTSRQNT